MTPQQTEALRERFKRIFKDLNQSFPGSMDLIADHWLAELSQALEREREVVREIVSGNHKGSFTDDAGNDCWYKDDLLALLSPNK